MYKLIITIILLPILIFSQKLGDVIYLKDGSIIKGLIIEQVPNDYIKIQSGPNLIVCKMDEIEKMTKEPVAPVTESWYTYWGLGFSKISYPSEMQELMDEIKDQEGISSASTSLDLLGFYWHIKPKTIGGVVINGSSERIQNETDDWFQINYYISGGSIIHYIDKSFGSGPFIRVDLGIADAVFQDSEGETVDSENGFGVLAGGGWSWDLGGTRVLLNINYAHRIIEEETYRALGVSIGGLF